MQNDETLNVKKTFKNWHFEDSEWHFYNLMGTLENIFLWSEAALYAIFCYIYIIIFIVRYVKLALPDL